MRNSVVGIERFFVTDEYEPPNRSPRDFDVRLVNRLVVDERKADFIKESYEVVERLLLLPVIRETVEQSMNISATDILTLLGHWR